MKINFGRKKIEVKLGQAMAGYAKERKVEKIHDDLFIHMFIIEQEQELFVFAIYDLLGIDEDLQERLQTSLNRKHPNVKQVIVIANHTHAGIANTLSKDSIIANKKPLVFGNSGQEIAMLEKLSVSLFTELIDDLKAFHYSLSEVNSNRLYTNRNNPDTYHQDTIVNLKLEREDKNYILSVISNHQTILGIHNQKSSRDLSYGIEKHLQEPFVYLNGVSADVSTRHTRELEGFAEIKRLGNKIAGLISNSLKMTEFKKPKPFELKTMAYPIKLKKEYGQELTINLNFINFSSTQVVFVPMEITSKLAEELHKQGIVVVTLANGYYGYLADEECFDKNYYEASTSIFKQGEGEKLFRFIQEQTK